MLNKLNELKSKFSFCTEVRGKGLLSALYFEGDISGQVLTLANQAGLLLNGGRPNAIRFMPPLTVTTDEIDEAMNRLDDALKQI